MPTDVSLSDPREHVDPVPASLAFRRDPREGEISWLDVLIVLAEWKKTILSVTAVFAILAGIVSLVLPKRYTASVSLLPTQQDSSMAVAFVSQFGNLSGGMAALAAGSLGLKNPNDMYVAMLKSRTVEESMVQRFGLMQEYDKKYLSDARKALKNMR